MAAGEPDGAFVEGSDRSQATLFPECLDDDHPVGREIAEMQRQRGDPHLRSAREVIGYYVAATDGDIGHVEDLLLDDADWTIRRLVIDTRNWLPGRKVPVDTDRLRSVAWAERHIVLGMTRSEVESSPEFDRTLTAAVQ